VQQGSAVPYQAGDYLFHESTPREWLGSCSKAKSRSSAGAGAHVTLATLVPGAVFSEGVMLDDSPHASSAVTRQGAKVWKISALRWNRRARPSRRSFTASSAASPRG
jgi:aspartate ammonia-lyase